MIDAYFSPTGGRKVGIHLGGLTEPATRRMPERPAGRICYTGIPGRMVMPAPAGRCCRHDRWLPLPAETFRRHDVGGYWVTGTQVEATERIVVSDLLGRHARARIELRITPSLWPFRRRVTRSTVAFSGSRLRNSAPGRPAATTEGP